MEDSAIIPLLVSKHQPTTRAEGSAEAAPKNKLSYFSFIWTTFLLTSAGPFGVEYTVVAVGVGYSLLLILGFALFYAFPISLISSELSGLMPSRHGQIIWAYRAFHGVSPKFGDFIGFLNAANAVIFWTLNTAVLPIVFNDYLMTITGELSWYTQYIIKLAVITSGLVLNALDFSVIANITSLICISMIVPFLIAFFWTLPKLNQSEWASCPNTDWALAITTILWEFAGFESLGNLVNDIGFNTRRLYSAFGFAIVADVVMLLIPIVAAATLATNDCSDWFDGYFASAFGTLTVALEYAVAIGSVTVNWCIYVSAVGIVSRMVWAIAQPHFKVRRDGQMVLEDEADESRFDAPNDPEDCIEIPINILPRRFIGELVRGRPLCASALVSALMALLNVWFQFDVLVEFNIFTYFNFFVIEVAAFLVLKHYEPSAPRMFEIPFGLAGAWISGTALVLILGACFMVMIVNEPYYFVVAVGLNIVLIIYYTMKSFIFKMCQSDGSKSRYLSTTGGVRAGEYTLIESIEE